MIRYYKLDVKKFLKESNNPKAEYIQKEALKVLSEKEAEMIKLQTNPPENRQEHIYALNEKYGIKYKRMYEIYETSRARVRDYLETEYAIVDLDEWFVFDFNAFFKSMHERRTETKLIAMERESIIELESAKENMGTRGGNKSDTTSTKVVRLEQLNNMYAQNKLCDLMATQIIEDATEFERDLIDTFFLDKFQYTSMGYKIQLLAQKYGLNAVSVYEAKRKLLARLEEWVKSHYIYNIEVSGINFAMSRHWNLLNR